MGMNCLRKGSFNGSFQSIEAMMCGVIRMLMGAMAIPSMISVTRSSRVLMWHNSSLYGISSGRTSMRNLNNLALPWMSLAV